MLDYIKAELLRFRAWAIAYAALNLVVLGFLTRVIDLGQQPLFAYQLFGAVYLLSGLLLGAYQMGNYRRPNTWLNLLHRPIPHRRLGAALMVAAALLLALGILLPALAVAGFQEGMTARVVDGRHLWLVASAWLLGCIGYLAGAYAMLANRRYAISGFVFVFGMLLANATGPGAVAMQLLAIAWLVAMVLASFKPDLPAPPRSVWDTVALALPLALAMWGALMVASFGQEFVWIASGTHPNNPAVPVVGSVKEADGFTSAQLLAAGLQGNGSPEANLWREQAAISDVHRVGHNFDRLPRRGELGNITPMEFDDATRRVRWVFSHDDMRFHGILVAEQRAAGTLGILGQAPFPQPPLPIGDGMLAADDAVYQYDEEAGRILPRMRLPAGEHVIGFGRAGDRLALLGDRALYLYDTRDLAISDAPLRPRARVPTPGRPALLAYADVMELLDGVLVSFTFTNDVFYGRGQPYQALVRVDGQGRAGEVARRDLPSGYSPLYLQRGWIASPVLYAAKQRLLDLFAGYQSKFDAPPRRQPRVVQAVALALLVLSLLLGLWRTQRVALPPAMRLAWLAACALLGLPALLALWLLYPPRERLDALPRRWRLSMLRNMHLPMLRFACALCLCAGAADAFATVPDEARDRASLAAIAAVEQARPRAPRLSRSAFLSQQILGEAHLSPDGARVVAMVDSGRDRSLWLADAAHPQGRRLLGRSDAQEMAFSHDGRWLFLVSPTQVYALAMAGQAGSGAVAQLGERNHRRFAGVDPWRPAAVLLLESPPRLSPRPGRWRLWRAQVGGRATLVHESRRHIVDFAFAPDGRLSHLQLAVGDTRVIVHQFAPGRWRALSLCEGTRDCKFLGTANGGRDLLLRTNLGGDLMSLQRLGADGRLQVLHADPRGESDLDEVVLDPADNVPLLVAYRSSVASIHGLRTHVQAAIEAIAARFPHSSPRLEPGRAAATPWLVHERSGQLRGERLHLFDPRTGRSVELFAQLAFQDQGRPVSRPPENAMARQVPVSWLASDGLRLHGFLWLPPGVDAAHAPLVVNVHGGPYNQVRPEFSAGAQFLANRGYIVFRPNFRASTGHGRRIVLASAGDFGGDGAVQRDIVEGTRWLLANGIGDADRVGITGASYGGYATLLGLSFQPELFKVGVASVPPSDFAFVIREYIGSGKELSPGIPMAATMRHLGVDPADRAKMARLHAGSPVANVARMRRPLLLLAGGEDDRVPIRGVTDYAARLKLLGRDVSLFVDADAGHNIVDARTREAYVYLEETLLHRYLGGAAPQPPSAELRAHLKRNLRLVGASLKGKT
jgi:dipeptidyl aminopeptidase/acylaminoacyl peptidase